ncbi:thiamine-monophosphate kinase [Sphingobium sp. TA15]|uniref:Thiamine-monophosphate kinase n=1 Tax=Sphingobium indicum (strain DSM 16413 / CCM 7287 / MTCC 6362 / UT26 / NBRC 101211 / UT26S) TaxID=452662 RepID=D4YXM9_SPHIU|nr:thiamine-phosphate kinase [Sphingobium indicum]BAI95111.1 thiamine-monophosphate kinase [Sphingobium indicum UT26S]BDD67989.1 thiamine-monophosphate kinase [Sphingobium sp. TA15]
MSAESRFLTLLRLLANDPAAQGLRDDVAVLEVGGARLILTSDTMVEGVHHLPADPPADIGWKLAAVNLSDLAAKGAKPLGCLLNYALSGDESWDAAFLEGLGEALARHAMPLLGGDTVQMPRGAPRSYSLTALGEATGPVPLRGGAKAGDRLYLTGPVGDAGIGLELLQTMPRASGPLVDAYRRPRPRLAEGALLAPHVHAMMDVSDGLLIDAARMAEASGLAVTIDHIPLSPALEATRGASNAVQIAAARAGDDYELLFALPAAVKPPVRAIPVGRFAKGGGLTLKIDGVAIPLPDRLGWEHG